MFTGGVTDTHAYALIGAAELGVTVATLFSPPEPGGLPDAQSADPTRLVTASVMVYPIVTI